MPSAVAYLRKARNAYRAQITDQLKNEGSTSQGLLTGAGVLLAAAGLKAHSDTLLVGGTALSTGYALGTTSMPRARVLAYMAGVDALNCAEVSVAPIRTFNADDLARANAELRKAVIALRSLKEAAAHKTEDPSPDIISANDSAEQTIIAANNMLSSTDNFLAKTKTVSYLLANQVEKVDAAVTRSIINGMPDLSDVKILSGAIGADITGTVGKAVNDANTSKQANGGTKSLPGGDKGRDKPEGQKAAVERMRKQQDEVLDLMEAVRRNLPPDSDNLNVQAMTECNLPSVPAPLVADIASVTFFTKAASTKSIELKGGTKEYVAETKGLPPGLTVKQPGPTGSTLEITSDEKLVAVGGYNLRVHDQTSGGSGIIIKITVAAAPAPADANKKK
jgi:hypothetical protein